MAARPDPLRQLDRVTLDDLARGLAALQGGDHDVEGAGGMDLALDGRGVADHAIEHHRVDGRSFQREPAVLGAASGQRLDRVNAADREQPVAQLVEAGAEQRLDDAAHAAEAGVHAHRGDTGLAGDPPDGEGFRALVLQQPRRRVEQRLLHLVRRRAPPDRFAACRAALAWLLRLGCCRCHVHLPEHALDCYVTLFYYYSILFYKRPTGADGVQREDR